MVVVEGAAAAVEPQHILVEELLGYTNCRIMGYDDSLIRKAYEANNGTVYIPI